MLHYYFNMGNCCAKHNSSKRCKFSNILSDKLKNTESQKLPSKGALNYKDQSASSSITDTLTPNFPEFQPNSLPIQKMKSKLQKFANEVSEQEGNFKESFEILQAILQNLVLNFEKPKYKALKKENPTFYKYIGQYVVGKKMMDFLGFKEESQAFLYSKDQKYAKNKLRDLKLVYISMIN